MSDRRLTPANDRVAAAHLTDAAPGLDRVAGTPLQVAEPIVDLLRAAGGARERQLLWGDVVDCYEDRAGMSFVQARKDGYVGYLSSAALAPVQAATHWVSAPACHVYETASIKSPDLHSLSFGSRICAQREADSFIETSAGFIPRVHLHPIGEELDDPVGVASLFLGTPYLWGGNSRAGIDCSGLVQAALLACGRACPADSDMQQASLGRDVTSRSDMRRADLLFWKGHVAMVVDDATLIHANGTDMAVVYEPIEAAINRISAHGEGPVTAHKRL